jgi:hypothetical protein
MLLFLQDWKQYPTAQPDLTTKNESFLRLASMYRKMRIKNHAFILALVNQELKGIDPHDPNLTASQVSAIVAECKINPWYFFREVVRAPGQSGEDARPFQANRANIALIWSFFNHALFTLIQPRQTGKSFSTDCLMRLLMNVLCKDIEISLLTKNDDLRRKNIQRLKDIGDELPSYIQQKRAADPNNGEQLAVTALNNRYSTYVPQGSPKAALALGRGITTAVTQIDEPPFQPNIKTALGALLAGSGAARDAAKRAGAPYGTILTTTAGKKNDDSGAYIYELISNSAPWSEAFLDSKDAEEFEKTVRRNGHGKFRIIGTFNHRQLGYTDAWLKEKMEDAIQEGEDAERDYLNVWTSGTMKSPFSKELTEIIANSQRSLMHSTRGGDGYVIRWYVTEDELEERLATSKIVMGMDTSDAIGKDDISMVLVDVETLEVLGVGCINETNLFTFSEWLGKFIVRYTNITTIIERKSSGGYILDYLLLELLKAGQDPFKRLFNRVVQEYEDNPSRYNEIKVPHNRRDRTVYSRFKETFGFPTSGSGTYSRSDLYNATMMNAVKRGGDRMHDNGLVCQILALERRDDRIDHPKGGHDDLVIGWLLANWLLSLGKNLSFYGIDPIRIMQSIKPKEMLSPEEKYQREEQKQIRNKIDILYRNLINEHDAFISQRLEFELRALDKKLVVDGSETYSVDDLLRKAKEARRSKKRAYDMGDRSIQDLYKSSTFDHRNHMGSPAGYKTVVTYC